MVETIHCIVLRTVKYSDTMSIATVWTAERGRMSVAVPSGSSREAKRLRAIMMPLGAFEAVARTSAGSDVARISDVRSLIESPAASGNPTKSVVAMFLADFLYNVLKECTPDALMTEFLMQWLDALRRISGMALANFHLAFAFRLGQFLGIAPDMGSYHRGRYLDLKEGRYTATAPLHTLYLEPDDAHAAWLLSRISLRTLGMLRLNRSQRNIMLDRILQYYSLHHAPVQNMPALAFLRDVWA